MTKYQEEKSSPNTIEKSLVEIQVNLEKFGLTAKQSKVYLFLGKNGTKTATEVNKALKLSRTETYQILSSLQNMGIISATFEHPVKFTAIKITEATALIIDSEKQKIKKLEKQKMELIELWGAIPIENNKKITDEKFQILQGKNRINSKINEMTNSTHSKVCIIGNESDFTNFYHLDILENITKVSEAKIITTSFEKIKHVYKGIRKENIREMPNSIKKDICFIIRNDEILFYMKNKSQKDVTAIWTNSNAMSYSNKLLFDELWKKSSKI